MMPLTKPSMKPLRSLHAVAATAVVAVVVAAGIAIAAGPEDMLGKAAPAFPAVGGLQTRAGKDPIAALRGRVVLLVFMDSRNGQCTDGIGDFNKIHDTFGPRGLTFLGVTAEEKDTLEPWLKNNKAKFGCVMIDTKTDEDLKRKYPIPGQPWSFLIDADGVIRAHGQPRNLDLKNLAAPYFEKVTKPPELPATLADAQKLLDDGTWAAAKSSLQASIDGSKLDKIDLAWAKGTVSYIDRRRPQVLAEAAELEKKGRWWDAWDVATDYQRRFEGMEGCDAAKAQCEAIRKNPAAADDLKNGDDVVKAKDFLKAGKTPAAKLILERISKIKGSRFADRAKQILATMPAK